MAEVASTARHDIVRDRPTWLSYLNIGLFGYFLYAFGPTVADHLARRSFPPPQGTRSR